MVVAVNETGQSLPAGAVKGTPRLNIARKPYRTRMGTDLVFLLNGLGVLPGERSLERLEALVKDDGVKDEAGLALVEQARGMQGKNKKAGTELAKKVRALNISKQVNQAADQAAQGRGGRGRKR